MTNEHSSHLTDLLPGFALGALDGDDRRDMEHHLAAGCPWCAAELRRLADDLEALALSVPPSQVEAAFPEITQSVRQRLLFQAARTPQTAPASANGMRRPGRESDLTPGLGRESDPTPRLRRGWATPSRVSLRSWMAIAALLLIALWGIMRQSRLDAEIARLRGERAQLMARAAELERRAGETQGEAEHLARTLALIAAPGVHSIELAGMGTSRTARGRAYIDAADRRAVFYGYHLPVLPADKIYQLWYVDDEDHNTSAGVFGVNPRGEGSLIVDHPLPIDRIQGWVVTIEPRGGRLQPTGPNALAG
jgi:anti-sigma-K factor RskA